MKKLNLKAKAYLLLCLVPPTKPSRRCQSHGYRGYAALTASGIVDQSWSRDKVRTILEVSYV